LDFHKCYIPTKTHKHGLNPTTMHWSDVFPLRQKKLRGQCINHLEWQLTTIVASHYMHTSKMKKLGFIKNKVLECITKVSVEKALLILIVDVKWSSLESRGAWIVMNQGIPNHMYEVKHPFTKYANCTWSRHCVETYVNTKLQIFWCTHISL